MVLCPPTQKRKISAFNASNRTTINADADAKKVVSVVDFYESDFGVQRIYPERFLSVDSTYYEWMLFLQKDLWSVMTLTPVKVEKLARTGLSQQVQISTAYTLECKQEKANAALYNLYNG
jgi:hypothetical protein